MNDVRYRALPLLALLAALCPALAATLEVSSVPYGKTAAGQAVEVYTLANSKGLKVRAMTLGATLIGVNVPDRAGKSANVTLHLDSFADYDAGHPSLGSTVGRFANRIGNARFVIDGKEFKITPNSAPHHIHGGKNGFGKLIWQAKPLRERDRVGVEFSLTSPDGEEGYPGTVKVRALYWLNEANELTFEYFGETDQPTHLNLTNHAYWNLGGAGSGDVLGHRLTLHADQYLAIDDKKIPTGPLVAVKGTPFDFTTPHTLGERIAEVAGGGYDHCYVVRRAKVGELAPVARVEDTKSGRVMEILTTQPGVQLYTANYLSNKLKAGGKAYDKHHGVCFEAQAFPDAPNKPSFPSSLLRPGETYHHITVHRFSWQSTNVFKVGQTWTIQAPPQERNASITIMRLEKNESLGSVVHVAVTGLTRSTQGHRGWLYMPFSENALRRSVVGLVRQDAQWPEQSDFEPFHHDWQERVKRGQTSGAFSITVAEVLAQQ